MKLKTSELEGAALDWVVGMSGAQSVKITEKGWVCAVGPRWWGPYEPSGNWAQCGALVENNDVWLSNDGESFIASCGQHTDGFIQEGPTALIAICRAIVAAKLGDTVDVPKELI